MNRAYRLIVVWMAGALGTVVVYGAHRLQSAERAACPTVPSFATLPRITTPFRRPASDDRRAVIVRYLQARYDEVDYKDDGYSVTGLAYIPTEAPLVEVHDPTLSRFLPDTHFYTTKLAAPYFEYREVVTLVSFRPAARGYDIRTCIAADFGPLSPKFLSQFIGISASTLQARQELALAIANLLARTCGDSAALSAQSVIEARAELLHNQRPTRLVDVMSGAYGRVDRVVVSHADGSPAVDVVVSAWLE